MKIFDFEKFKDETSDKIEEMLKDVPTEWKSEVAGFISMQAIIFGASNMYEGIGILETNKLEYIDICNEVFDNDDEDDIYLN